jgi:hypothetical protein
LNGYVGCSYYPAGMTLPQPDRQSPTRRARPVWQHGLVGVKGNPRLFPSERLRMWLQQRSVCGGPRRKSETGLDGGRWWRVHFVYVFWVEVSCVARSAMGIARGAPTKNQYEAGLGSAVEQGQFSRVERSSVCDCSIYGHDLCLQISCCCNGSSCTGWLFVGVRGGGSRR